MNKNDNGWGWNPCRKLEAMCLDLDGFVFKEQMQTVGETVKKFYSDVMQDLFLSPVADPTQHIPQFSPSKRDDLVETSANSVSAIKEDFLEAPMVPETCYKKPEDVFCNASSQSYKSEFKDFVMQVHRVINLNLGTEEKIKVEPLIDLEEKCDASECEDGTDILDLNLDIEEKIEAGPLSDICVFEDGWGITNMIDLNMIPVEKIEVEPPMNLKEICDDDHSQASRAISNDTTRTDETDPISGSYTKKHGQLEASISWSEIGAPDGSYSVDFESNGKKLAETSVIKAGKSKSYKKMIQDVFMSKKRIAKEYKQLAVLYGDIDKKSAEENKLVNIGTTDFPDSEWELV